MLKKFLGYILAGIGFVVFIFFRNYNGDIIPYPVIWLCLSIAIGIAGLYLSLRKSELQEQKQVERNDKTWEKIILTKDTCEIRENNYYEEVTDNSTSRVAMFDALYDSNRNHHTEFIEQSAIIYFYETAGKKIKMTSQSFPCNRKTLSSYVENGEVALFINRFDKNDYEFEIID